MLLVWYKKQNYTTQGDSYDPDNLCVCFHQHPNKLGAKILRQCNWLVWE